MENDAHIVERIAAVLHTHLRLARLEARELIAQLATVDKDRADAELAAAIDSYGSDMITDAVSWLRRQTDDEAIAEYRAGRAAEAKRVPRG